MGSRTRLDKRILHEARDDLGYGYLGIFPSYFGGLLPLGF